MTLAPTTLVVLLCVALTGCASPDDAVPDAPPAYTDSVRTDSARTDSEASPAASERPPADPDVFHFVQVENDGRGLRAADGAPDAGGWTIRYRIANPAEPPVYLVGCNDPPAPQLQKWLDGEWKPVHSVMDDACRSPAWEIRGGEALPASPAWSEVRVVYEPGAHPGTEGDTTRRGTYRLATALFTSDPDPDLASATQVVRGSRSFRID